MKTLPLVDRNLFLYSFISALPLSLEENIYLKTQGPLWNLPGPMLCALGKRAFYRKFFPRLNSAFSLFSSLMV